jgi:tetratricopeptide (TPR) repeat protein
MKQSDQGGKKSDMDCQKVEDQEIIERYLAERLSEPELEAFEQHYIECQRCFGELKLRHAAAIELARQPVPLRAAPRPRFSSWQWGLASTVAAVAILIGILYLRPREETRVPVPQIAAIQQPDAALVDQLAVIGPVPPYIAGVIRGGETDPAQLKFQEGMDLYSRQKYSDAIGPLTEAARLDPARPMIAFYLGISYLASGNPDAAVEQLSKITAQESAYSEEGHWFLAKAYLRKRDFNAARKELQAVQSLHGAYAGAAQDLLNQIRNF